MKHLLLTAIVLLSGLMNAGLPTSQAAQLTNRNFETGDFRGWSVMSQAPSFAYLDVVDSSSGFTPLQGGNSALIVSLGHCPPPDVAYFVSPWCVGLENPTPPTDPIAGYPLLPKLCSLLYLQNGSLPSGLDCDYGFAGAYVGQEFDAGDGDQLSFLYQYLTDDGTTTDQLFVVLMGPSIVYADLNPVEWTDGVGGFRIASAPSSFSVEIPSSGHWSVFIGSGQANDTLASTGMLLDDVKLSNQAVPEPGSLALLILGLAGLAFTRRRRQ